MPDDDFDADEELDPDLVRGCCDGIDNIVPDHGLVLLVEAKRDVCWLQVVGNV